MLDPDIFEEQLSIEEYKRYSRHLILDEIGIMGQSRLKFSKILIVGLGGLGSLASMYLVAAGVGQIGIVDYDSISLSNLQRQILYDTLVIDKKKALIGQQRLQQINPACKIVIFDTKLTTQNAQHIVADYDVIMDASDNFFTRYLLSDISVLYDIPIVYGAILGQIGHLSVFNYKGGPTYRDLFYERPLDNIALSCSEGGVFGGVAAVISSMQVNEVMKIILGLHNVMSGKLLMYDFSKASFRTILLRKRLLYSRTQAFEYFKNLQVEEINSGFMKMKVEANEVIYSDIVSYVEDPSCLVIDVRSKIEYESMHLANAHNFSLEQLSESSVLDSLQSSLSDGHYLLVYCSFDSRSLTAARILADFGIKTLRLRGGLKALGF
nr:moeB [Erythrotrichia foliiformis]